MKKCILLLFAFCLFTSHLVHSQWYQQTIPVTKPIIGIKFIDSLKGWAATSWGTAMDSSYVLHTSNGGTNWIVQFRYPGTFFEALAVIDANTGYVGGYAPLPGPGALIFKTTNGGLNWFNAAAPSGPTDMFFINRDTGWYCNNAFASDIRRTTDGGSTWQLMNSGIAASVYRLYFLNYTTGFCGAQFYLYKTTNAGINWVQYGDFGSENIYGIYYYDLNNGWLGLSGGKIGLTTNGGVNWSIIKPFPLIDDNIYNVVVKDKIIGWAGIGWFQKIYKTTNSGLNWGYQTVPTSSINIWEFDTLLVWAGSLGISHTTNGGGPITYVGIIKINSQTPALYSLSQNYPNPFNSRTQIRFSLTKPSYVKLKIYDVLGKEKTIWESTGLLSIGTHKLEFNAESADGGYSSGVYFYQITILNEQSSVVYRETRKMILVK